MDYELYFKRIVDNNYHYGGSGQFYWIDHKIYSILYASPGPYEVSIRFEGEVLIDSITTENYSKEIEKLLLLDAIES